MIAFNSVDLCFQPSNVALYVNQRKEGVDVVGMEVGMRLLNIII